MALADDALDDLRFPLEVSVEPAGDAVVLRLIGHLDLSTTATLWSCLETLDSRVSEVELDLSRMSFLDSTGLGQLINARRRFAAEGRVLVLRHPSDHARFVFDLTGLGDLISD
jgi:anti-sigma B factor antagonist